MFGSFFGKSKPNKPNEFVLELLSKVANPAEFNEEELVALKTASISQELPASKMENAPDSLVIEPTGRRFAKSFFALLRQSADPPPEAWDEVRKEWPVLAEKTNDDLLKALGPIKAVAIDVRQL